MSAEKPLIQRGHKSAYRWRCAQQGKLGLYGEAVGYGQTPEQAYEQWLSDVRLKETVDARQEAELRDLRQKLRHDFDAESKQAVVESRFAGWRKWLSEWKRT